MNKEKIILEDIRRLQERNDLLDFLNKLFIFSESLNTEATSNLIRVIYKNANIFSKNGRENYWQSEYDRATGLVFYLINQKFDCNEIKSIIYEIIENSTYIPFIFNTVYFCTRAEGGNLHKIYECMNINEFLEKVLTIVNKHYIEDNNNIFEELEGDRDASFVLYQWATKFNRDGFDNYETVNNYVLSFVSKDYTAFLKLISTFYTVDHYSRNDSKTFRFNDLGEIVSIKELLIIAESILPEIKDIELKEMVDVFIQKAKSYLDKL